MSAEATRKVHEAISGLLGEGELALSWALTIDVVGPDDVRYLAHRSGGGVDGDKRPEAWLALGMLRSSVLEAEAQLLDMTEDADDEEDDDT